MGFKIFVSLKNYKFECGVSFKVLILRELICPANFLAADIHQCPFLVLCLQCPPIPFPNTKNQEQNRGCSSREGRRDLDQVRPQKLFSSCT